MRTAGLVLIAGGLISLALDAAGAPESALRFAYHHLLSGLDVPRDPSPTAEDVVRWYRALRGGGRAGGGGGAAVALLPRVSSVAAQPASEATASSKTSVWRSTSASLVCRRDQRHVVEGSQQHAAIERVQVQVALQLGVGGGVRLGPVAGRLGLEAILGAAAELGHVPRHTVAVRRPPRPRREARREGDGAGEGLLGEDVLQGRADRRQRRARCRPGCRRPRRCPRSRPPRGRASARRRRPSARAPRRGRRCRSPCRS